MREFLFYIFSLIFGSFLNVCIYRLPRGESVVYPPSHCPICKQRIKPYDLIPIVSFIILKGRCRACKTKISRRYPFVEFLSLLCAILAYDKFDLSIKTFLIYLIACVLIYISFVDIEKMEISNLSVFLLLFLCSLSYYLEKGFSWVSIKQWFLGGIYSSTLVLLIYIISQGSAMGFGDVLLIFAGSIGFEWQKAVLVNFLSFVSGALWSAVMLAQKRKTLKQQIPFAPFISAAIYITILYGEEIIEWYLDYLRF